MCCVCSLVLALDVKYFRNNINIIINNDDDDDDDNNNKDIKTRRLVTSALAGHAPTPAATPRPRGRKLGRTGCSARRGPGAWPDSEVTVEIKAGASSAARLAGAGAPNGLSRCRLGGPRRAVSLVCCSIPPFARGRTDAPQAP